MWSTPITMVNLWTVVNNQNEQLDQIAPCWVRKIYKEKIESGALEIKNIFLFY